MADVKQNILMFPGQGCQAVGMGAKLFEQTYLYRQYASDVNDILGYDLQQLCLSDPDQRLNITQYTQPAIYVVNALHYFSFLDKGQAFNVSIGHSLGELNALLSAGCFDFLTGVKIAKARAEAMSLATAGGMMAVIGSSGDHIQSTLDQCQCDQVVIANVNSLSQVVVSGDKQQLRVLEKTLQEQSIKVVVLPVSAAFHSPYMQPISEQYRDFLNSQSLGLLQTPVYANADCAPYPADVSIIIDRLVEQLYKPVNWLNIMTDVKARYPDANYVELGHGQTLTKFAMDIDQPSRR